MEEITIQEIRNFNRFYTQILGLLDRHIVQSPFTLPEARVLYELNACQPATATLLAEKLGMDKGLLSRILSAFEKKKMLCKLPNSEDGRSRFVQLTQEGKTAFEAINMAANRQIMGLLSGKSVAQKKQIVEAMHSLRRVLADQTSGKDDHSLDDIHIRTDLQPGDLGALIQMHAKVYQDEYDYGIAFESYVAQGVAEFYQSYDPEKSRIWIAEHRGVRVGYLALMERGAMAQLRYFVLDRYYRGIGLGKRMMELFMDYLKDKNYQGAYLWTVDELPAAAALYRRYGFLLTEESPSTAFGKPLMEQRYDLKLE